MGNKKRRNIDDQIRIHRGAFPWSVQEYNWIVANFDERLKNKEKILQLSEDFVGLKDDMENFTGREMQNFKSMVLLGDIFHKRYPKKIEYEANFFRFHQINKFMQTYHDDLVKMKLVEVKEDRRHIAPQLLETLCTILYNQEEEDESGEFIGCSFSYPEVIATTKARINAPLN